MTTPDPIRQRAQEVADTELRLLDGTSRGDLVLLGALKSAYLQGRVDVRIEMLRELADKHAELAAAATAARSVA